MVECGNGVCLLLSMIVMMVADASSTPDSQLSDIDPFKDISTDLNIPDWNPKEETQKTKLRGLALAAFNNVRKLNGLEGNLQIREDLASWTEGFSEALLDFIITSVPDTFTVDEKEPFQNTFSEYVHYKKADKEDNSTSSDYLVESIRKWYTEAREKVKTGAKKDSIPFFHPDTKHVGFGLAKKSALVKDNTLMVSHYTSMFAFATDSQYEKFKLTIKK